MPERIISALSIAIYGMFLAIILPPAKGNRLLACIILISMLMSLLFAKLSMFAYISGGFKIIILTVLIAGIAALLFPIKDEGEAVDFVEHSAASATEKGGAK